MGFYGETATIFSVLAILLAIAAFWSSIWQLVSDGARRVQASMAEFERLAAQQSGSHGPDAAGGTSTRRPPRDGGDDEVIIIHEVRD